jgi:hypothetical protein
MLRPLLAFVALSLSASACNSCTKSEPGLDPIFARAVECVGASESCVTKALGRADLELPGPNGFDDRWFYDKQQFTVDLVHRAVAPGKEATVNSVSTGVTHQAGSYGGAYPWPVLGIRIGDTVESMKKAWGPGEPEAPRFIHYRGKVKPGSGRSLTATVGLEGERVAFVSFHLD